MDWFRSFHGAPLDAKHVTVAKRSETQPGVSCAIWWALLDYASQHEDRGSVDGFDPEVVADFFGWSLDTVARVVQAMTHMKMISDGRITNWEKRQPKREDDSTSRVRSFRSRQKAPGSAVKRNVTLEESREEEIREENNSFNNDNTPAREELETGEAPPDPPPAADPHANFDDRLPIAAAGDLLGLLKSVRNPARWRSALKACLDGMPGHRACTGEQLAQALAHFALNGAPANWALFDGYLAKIVRGETEPVRQMGSEPRRGRSDTGDGRALLDASALIDLVRANRSPQYPRSPIPGFSEGLADYQRRAINAVGGLDVLLGTHDATTDRILAAQLAKVLRAAADDSRTTVAAA